jgi:hypothetical protein
LYLKLLKILSKSSGGKSMRDLLEEDGASAFERPSEPEVDGPSEMPA